jgi:hypothetical protein
MVSPLHKPTDQFCKLKCMVHIPAHVHQMVNVEKTFKFCCGLTGNYTEGLIDCPRWSLLPKHSWLRPDVCLMNCRLSSTVNSWKSPINLLPIETPSETTTTTGNIPVHFAVWNSKQMEVTFLYMPDGCVLVKQFIVLSSYSTFPCSWMLSMKMFHAK